MWFSLLTILTYSTLIFDPTMKETLAIREDQLRERCIQKTCPKEKCLDQRDWETAYFKVFGRDTICAFAVYEKGRLSNYVPHPTHHKCYLRKRSEFCEQEGFSFPYFKEKYFNGFLPKVKFTNTFKIPKNLHFVFCRLPF